MESQEPATNNQAARGRDFTCPLCHRTVKRSGPETAGQMRFFPFCSEHCKLIDLGAWLEADYRILCPDDDESEGPLNQGPPGLEDPP